MKINYINFDFYNFGLINGKSSFGVSPSPDPYSVKTTFFATCKRPIKRSTLNVIYIFRSFSVSFKREVFNSRLGN